MSYAQTEAEATAQIAKLFSDALAIQNTDPDGAERLVSRAVHVANDWAIPFTAPPSLKEAASKVQEDIWDRSSGHAEFDSSSC